MQQAIINRDQFAIRINEFERSMNMQVQNSRLSYNNALARLTDRRKNLQLAERIYNTTQIKLKEGVGSSIELTSAERELYDAQANMITSLYDLLSAKLDLEKALGK
jgi:outer membrane protein TolC